MRPARGRRALVACGASDAPGVDRPRAPVAGLPVVLDAGALGQRAGSLGDDRRVVNEEVLARLVRRDEAEALVVVEPLHRSGGHTEPSTLSCCVSRRMLMKQRPAPPALPRRALTRPYGREHTNVAQARKV